MCRLIGLIQTGEAASLPVVKHLVASSNSLKRQAEYGCVPPGTTRGHDHSWGIASLDAANNISLTREVGSAADSDDFDAAAAAAESGTNTAGPARIIVGHLRKASAGDVNIANAHPIPAPIGAPTSKAGRPSDTLLVAHNGTIKEPLLASLRPEVIASGRTMPSTASDTVILANWLASRLDEATTVDPFEPLAESLRILFSRAKKVATSDDLTATYTGVNLIIAHTTGLYILRQYSYLQEYYTLYARPLNPENEEIANGYIVASEPTDIPQSAVYTTWKPLKCGEMLHFAPNGSTRTARVA